jgi:hypothetical protein
MTMNFKVRYQNLKLLLLFDVLFLINVFKGKISCSSVFDTVSLGIPTRSIRDSLLLLYIVISRSVPQPDVFLLPMQSVGASTSLTKIVFCSLMSASFLNKNNCSLFLCHFFVFNCILLCFILFSILVLALISSSAIVKHLSKWIELN